MNAIVRGHLGWRPEGLHVWTRRIPTVGVSLATTLFLRVQSYDAAMVRARHVTAAWRRYVNLRFWTRLGN